MAMRLVRDAGQWVIKILFRQIFLLFNNTDWSDVVPVLCRPACKNMVLICTSIQGILNFKTSKWLAPSPACLISRRREFLACDI
jgi:hypothetical protein